jgi:HSP20 family protein
MTHVKFNRRPFDRTFNTLLDDIFAEVPVLYKNDFNPQSTGSVPVNITENEKQYRIDVIAPGFEKADFKINLDQNVLTVSLDKKSEATTEGQKQVRKEYSFRSFKRSFTLDDKIDASAIEAKYVNGVLTLNLPKKEEVKSASKDISIQ